jgi:hypothetical protein
MEKGKMMKTQLTITKEIENILSNVFDAAFKGSGMAIFAHVTKIVNCIEKIEEYPGELSSLLQHPVESDTKQV